MIIKTVRKMAKMDHQGEENAKENGKVVMVENVDVVVKVAKMTPVRPLRPLRPLNARIAGPVKRIAMLTLAINSASS